MQHPLKQNIDKINALINEVHQLYNLYFQGFERQPPHGKRNELNKLMEVTRREVRQKNQAGVTFLFNQTEAKFTMYRNRWEKVLAEIEQGSYKIPLRPRGSTPPGGGTGGGNFF